MDKLRKTDGRHSRLLRPGAAPTESSHQEAGSCHTCLFHRRTCQSQGMSSIVGMQ